MKGAEECLKEFLILHRGEYIATESGALAAMEIYAAQFKPVMPTQDDAVSRGFQKATSVGYNLRRVCRNPESDIYYTGWMDSFGWYKSQIEKQNEASQNLQS